MRTNHNPARVAPNPTTELIKEEITLQKIATLEDDYSKMKMALLSTIESDDELSPEEEAKACGKVMVEEARTTRIDSQNFLGESTHSNRDLSRTHGKASTVAEFVELEHKLGAASAVKHEDVLGRSCGQHTVYTIPEEEDQAAWEGSGRRSHTLHALKPILHDGLFAPNLFLSLICKGLNQAAKQVVRFFSLNLKRKKFNQTVKQTQKIIQTLLALYLVGPPACRRYAQHTHSFSSNSNITQQTKHQVWFPKLYLFLRYIQE